MTPYTRNHLLFSSDHVTATIPMKHTIYFLAIQRAIQAIRDISKFKPAELNEQEQAQLTELKNLLKEPPKITHQFFAYMESSIVYQGEVKTSQRCGGLIEGFDIIELAKELRTSFAKDINTTPDKILIKSLSII